MRFLHPFIGLSSGFIHARLAESIEKGFDNCIFIYHDITFLAMQTLKNTEFLYDEYASQQVYDTNYGYFLSENESWVMMEKLRGR